MDPPSEKRFTRLRSVVNDPGPQALTGCALPGVLTGCTAYAAGLIQCSRSFVEELLFGSTPVWLGRMPPPFRFRKRYGGPVTGSVPEDARVTSSGSPVRHDVTLESCQPPTNASSAGDMSVPIARPRPIGNCHT